VQRTLRADVPPSLEHSSRRRRVAQEKLTDGRIGGLAEIVRDGIQRERRLAPRAGSRFAAPRQNDLYRQARRLLAAEVAACRGIEPEAADSWVLAQASAERP
jgi:RNA polymerase-interacting CarD/CdnL/TRCF family regulator